MNWQVTCVEFTVYHHLTHSAVTCHESKLDCVDRSLHFVDLHTVGRYSEVTLLADCVGHHYHHLFAKNANTSHNVHEEQL